MPSRHIEYTVAATRLGLLLVAATERGVCHVRFGDRAPELEAGLAREFPYASIRCNEVALKPWRDALVSYVEGHSARIDVPLDVGGSRFERRVWDALRRIPRGHTRSYGAVAAEIGAPRGARAVARACARNPVPLAIPCHRVVPARGGSGGYRFGAERKRALLALESAEPTQPLEPASAR